MKRPRDGPLEQEANGTQDSRDQLERLGVFLVIFLGVLTFVVILGVTERRAGQKRGGQNSDDHCLAHMITLSATDSGCQLPDMLIFGNLYSINILRAKRLALHLSARRREP